MCIRDSSTIVWVPVAAMLLYIIIKNNKIQEALVTIVMIALVITLADQIASGLCKPFFARFRPTQDPNIMYMVDIVNGPEPHSSPAAHPAHQAHPPGGRSLPYGAEPGPGQPQL